MPFSDYTYTDKVKCIMSKLELEWVPLYILEQSHDIRNLSDESVAAYTRLQVEFFSTGKLPVDDNAVRRIAKLERSRQWATVKEQLQKDVFTDGWRHTKWERALEDAQQRIAKNRSRTAAATAARNAAPPEREYGDVPF
jgi:uncharacterized protein YdaU (DUF1376 family)